MKRTWSIIVAILMLVTGMAGTSQAATPVYKNIGSVKADDVVAKGPIVDVRYFMDGKSGRPTLSAWTANNSVNVASVMTAAIASLNNSGTLLLPKGTLNIGTTTLTFNGGISIVGVGVGNEVDRTLGSIIRYTGTNEAIRIGSGAGITTAGGVFRNFTLSGDGTGVNGVILGNDSGSSMLTGKAMFDNVVITDFAGAGMIPQVTSGLVLNNVQFQRSDIGFDGPAMTTSYSTTIAFRSCRFTRNRIGERLSAADVYVHDNCIFESNTEEGTIVLPGASGHTWVFATWNDCWWEANNTSRTNGPYYQFKAGSPTSKTIDMIHLNRPRFAVAGTGNKHIYIQDARVVLKYPTYATPDSGSPLGYLGTPNAGSTSTVWYEDWLYRSNEWIVNTNSSFVKSMNDYGLDTAASPRFVGLSLTGLTQGSVPFIGSSGVVSQDNTNLYYDSTLHRLGIGGQPPSNSGFYLAGQSAIRVDSVTTDETLKTGRLTTGHYTNANAPMQTIAGTSDSSDNTVNIGGGSSVFNAATRVSVYAASDTNTKTGTEQIRVDSTGTTLNNLTKFSGTLQGNMNFHGQTSQGYTLFPGSNTGVQLDFDAGTEVTSGAVQFRFGRSTNTSGLASVDIYTMDGANTYNHRLRGNGDSFLSVLNGKVGIGQNSTLDGRLDIRESGTGNILTGYSNQSTTPVERMLLTGFGNQKWWLNSGSAEVGRVELTTPGGGMGWLFYAPSSTGTSMMKMLGTTGGWAWGSVASGATPSNQMTLDNAGNLATSGTMTVGTGGSTNHAVCWKTAGVLGYCSTVVAADGSCTCN